MVFISLSNFRGFNPSGGCGIAASERIGYGGYYRSPWKILFGALFTFALWIATQSPSLASRYYVKPDGNDSDSGTSWTEAFQTLNKAVSVTVSGDEVWVAEGTYREEQMSGVYETISIPSGISLFGGFSGTETDRDQRNWEDHATIIDAFERLQRRGVSNEGILDGFHVTGGNKMGEGGGIYNDGGSIMNCKVYNNSVFGLYGSGACGGGIYNVNGSITNCTVCYNGASGIKYCSAAGGGIYNIQGSITNCTVYGNSLSAYDNHRDGGGIFNSNGSITNCIVYENNASNGGGIFNNHYGNDAQQCSVTNCTVYGNDASSGGGIFNKSIVTNCIVWNNTPGDIYGSPEKVRYSCFVEGTWGTGNLRANPLFVNTSDGSSTWSLQLSNGSPCVDAGTLEGAPTTDIRGNARPGADGKVCMGAFESPPEYISKPAGPGIRLYVKSNGGNDAADGVSWAAALQTISQAIKKFPNDGNIHEIWVATGTYPESATLEIPVRASVFGGFIGSETELSQRDWTAHPTILDGQDKQRCVTNNGILDGLHVTGGLNEDGGGILNYGSVTNCQVYDNLVLDDCGGCGPSFGGGVYNLRGSVTNCIIHDNSMYIPYLDSSHWIPMSQGRGGGLCNEEGYVANCILYNNTIDAYQEYGGGIYNSSGSVINCIIYGNEARIGGGIFIISGSIINCTVFGNKGPMYGGGIVNDGGLVANCTVYDNTARQGGGIGVDGGSIINCTVSRNEAWEGGGVYNDGGSITNCTVYGNHASNGGGVFNENFITNSIVWNNTPGDIYGSREKVTYSCFVEGTWGTGNLRANPLFVNPWDLRLSNGSPCVDAGTLEGSPATDIRGNARPGADGKVCMGAFESPAEYTPLSPTLGTRFYVNVDGGNDAADGSSWSTALQTISEAMTRIPNDDDLHEIWVATGTYMESTTIQIPGRVALFGGFEGDETNLSQRDWITHASTIDGMDIQQCVTNAGILDGFRVARGRNGSDGGGIENYGAVANCIVYNNAASSQYGNGGGIYNDNGSVVSCIVYGNAAASSQDSNGGGVYNYIGSVMNCIIFDNTASFRGGGMYDEDGSVENCIVYDNMASLVGGGISNDSGSIVNCTVYGNTAQGDYGGGGIYSYRGSIMNCTVYGNKASIQGGGIHSIENSIANCIVWGNTVPDIYQESSGTIAFSCFKEELSGTGNLHIDPLFMNISGDPSTWDLGLRANSPCIDKGTSSDAPAFDIDGIARPQGAGVDMGAYEWSPAIDAARIILGALPSSASDPNGDGIMDVADVIHVISSGK